MQKKFSNELLNELFSEPETTSVYANAQVSGYVPKVFSAFKGKILLISFSGAIGLASIDEFKTSLFATLTGGAQQIVVELKDVTELSSSSIGVMIDFASTVLGRGKEMYLFMPSESVLRSLNDLQLTIFFEILPGEGALVSLLPEDY